VFLDFPFTTVCAMRLSAHSHWDLRAAKPQLASARQARGLCRIVWRLPVTWVIFLLLPIQPASPQQQGGGAAEYGSKATFLTTFPTFVEWPQDAFASPQAPLVVCVRGDFSFGTALAERARGEAPHGRHIDVRWVHKDQDLRACHIAFISRSEIKRYPEILQGLAGAHVMSVGETPNFLEAGGVLAFILRGNTLRFEINLGAAASAQLRISSRLLALAVRVVNQTETARGQAHLSSPKSFGLLPAQNSIASQRTSSTPKYEADRLRFAFSDIEEQRSHISRSRYE
jgi:YfiR/HmsC-like